MRTKSSIAKSETAALLRNKANGNCTTCGTCTVRQIAHATLIATRLVMTFESAENYIPT